MGGDGQVLMCVTVFLWKMVVGNGRFPFRKEIMKVSKSVKWIIGIATAWSVLNPIVFIALVFVLPWDLIVHDASVFMNSTLVKIALGLLGLTIVNQLALMVFYLIHVVKNSAAEESVRIVLGLGFFFMTVVAMPVYYYLYVWRETPPEWAAGETVEPSLSEDAIAFAGSPSIEELKEEEKRLML